MIQDSIKLKSCSLEWLFQPSKLAKFDSLWIWVCAIVAVSGILGSNIHFPIHVFFLLTMTFLISIFSKKNLSLLPFSLPPFLRNLPPFYNGVLVFPGNRWFPCFAFSWTESIPCLLLGKSHFPFFSFLPSFSFDSFQSPWLATFFGMCWGMPFSASPF